MQTHEIARRFTEHFVKAGHTRVPSASLILDDPTLLFVNAGMVPFKPYFLGEAPAPYPRATSIQKCVRTGDIDEVGKTTRHNTFFQMAGNFSFGDYFKAGAIEHAWNLVTGSQDAGGYGFDPDRIWVTVYLDDDEAADLWRRIAGLPPERIQRRSGKDNYWDMGVPGPGGPCSEIYYDRGPEHGREGGPVVDEDRYLEIWNLVFMQDVRGELSPKDGHPPVGELPRKNIDTGLGIERVATLLQGVGNVYETDLVRPVIERAEQLSGRRYGANATDDVRFRVIADHARSGVMIIGDGVTPGNEGRGYVLRRLLRRIVRSARLLGVTEPVLRGLRRGRPQRDEPLLPGAHHRVRADLGDRARRGGGVPRHAHRRLTDLRHGGDRHEAGGRHAAGRRQGLPAARHVRLPDRPHPGDGLGGRALGRRRGLPPAHGRAARPGQGGRRGPQDRARRHGRLPGRARRRGRHAVPRLHGPAQRVADRRPGRRRGRGAGRRGGRRPSRWCWTAPRSTPRAAASRPTPA